MKKFTLMLMALLAFAGSMNAKTFETTLWEDTYTEAIELNAETVATFKAGNVLRIYVTVPKDGANFKIVYKGAPNWTETTIPSIANQWPWVNGGNTYYDLQMQGAFRKETEDPWGAARSRNDAGCGTRDSIYRKRTPVRALCGCGGSCRDAGSHGGPDADTGRSR